MTKETLSLLFQVVGWFSEKIGIIKPRKLTLQERKDLLSFLRQKGFSFDSDEIDQFLREA